MSDLATLKSFAFDDFDAFASSIEDADMSMKLPRLDRSLWSMEQIGFADATNIQVAYEGSGSIPAGAVCGDGFVLFLADGDCQGNGEHIDRDSVFLIPPRTEFCNPTQGENEWMGIFIPYATAEATGVITSRDVIGNSARVIRPSRGAAERLRSHVKRFVGNAQADPSLLQQIASVTSFREVLGDCVMNCLFVDAAKPKRRTGRPKTADAKLIVRAVELVEDSPETTPTVKELVAALGVSERSVQSGFKEFLGLTPRKYIELRRLHQARQRLAASSLGETTVTQVAAELGMWDFGRFASRYRALYGELPSETLKRR